MPQICRGGGKRFGLIEESSRTYAGPRAPRVDRTDGSITPSAGLPGPLEMLVLHSLGDMLHQDVFGPGEIRNGSGNPQNAMHRPGAHRPCLHGPMQQRPGGVVNSADVLDLRDGHLGIRVDGAVDSSLVGCRRVRREPLYMQAAGRHNPVTDRSGGICPCIVRAASGTRCGAGGSVRVRPSAPEPSGQLSRRHGWHLYMHVDPVEQRPTQPIAVGADLVRCTTTRTARVAQEATHAPLRCHFVILCSERRNPLTGRILRMSGRSATTSDSTGRTSDSSAGRSRPVRTSGFCPA